jgi:ATP-dependent DNA helicase PIF1
MEGKKVGLTALTGVAAVNLGSTLAVSACTLHSWTGIGLGDLPLRKLVGKVLRSPTAVGNIRESDVLIIDEISMLGVSLFENLDYVMKEVRKSQRPFGGLKLLLSGDFLQLPPVNDEWIFTSSAWTELNLYPVLLSVPMRYDYDKNSKAQGGWFETLSRIRVGNPNESDINFLESRVEAYSDWLGKYYAKEAEEKLKGPDREWIVKPTMLYSRRADVDNENAIELHKLPGKEIIWSSEDIFIKTKNEEEHINPEVYFSKLDEQIPNKISLKVGAQVMLKANIYLPRGLANGSRGVVNEINFPHGVMVKWLSGLETFVIPFSWEKKNVKGAAVRKQIPLILGWAYTIHKSQSCTLEYAIINLGGSVFCYGQAYVALSRVKTKAGLFIEEFTPNSIRADPLAISYVEELENSKIASRVKPVYFFISKKM